MSSGADDPAPSATDVEAEVRRSRRSVAFIVSVVAAALAVCLALGAWVLFVPYEAKVTASDGTVQVCEEPAATDACERAVDDARSSRRNTALLIGAGAFVVATAVSTWPSRRLTGERLGPLRP